MTRDAVVQNTSSGNDHKYIFERDNRSRNRQFIAASGNAHRSLARDLVACRTTKEFINFARQRGATINSNSNHVKVTHNGISTGLHASSLALKFSAALASSSLSRSVPKFYPRPIIPLSRFFTPSILLSVRNSSSGSSTADKIDALEIEIVAIKHLLKGGNLTTAPSDIRESVQIYEGGSKDWLRSMLGHLQREKAALVKASVESKGR